MFFKVVFPLRYVLYSFICTMPFLYFRYGGFDLGMPLPFDLKMDVTTVPKNRTLSKVTVCPATLLPVWLLL